jgi:hypothetical protein
MTKRHLVNKYIGHYGINIYKKDVFTDASFVGMMADRSFLTAKDAKCKTHDLYLY